MELKENRECKNSVFEGSESGSRTESEGDQYQSGSES